VLVETNESHLPFSFFHYVFVSNKIPLKEEVKEIIDHELCHVKNLHSLDIIALELVHILFWFNPILILYKKALRHAHEYIADATVLERSDIKNYGQILLGQTSSGMEVALANHFFNSQLKNRITMMYQKKSGKGALVKYLAAVPILLLTAFLFSNSVMKENPVHIAFKNDVLSLAVDGDLLQSSQTMEVNTIINSYLNEEKISMLEANNLLNEIAPQIGFLVSVEGEKIIEKICITEYKVIQDTIPYDLNNEIDQMPMFHGCENNDGTITELQKCANESLMKYLYTEIRYPKMARDQGIQGQVLVQFIVTKEGKIAESKIIRGIGGGCDEEALSIINGMNNIATPWAPGMKDGKSVNIKLTLPINFKLEGDHNKNKPSTKNQQTKTKRSPNQLDEMVVVGYGTDQSKSQNEVFTTVEEMPRFPGCEKIAGSDFEIEQCAKNAMLQFIYQNLTYPKIAKDNGVQGMTVIQFVVTKDGNIRDAKVVRDIGASCGDEALKVVEKMNSLAEKWTPGRQKGKAVDVLYTLPVRFKLTDEEKTFTENGKIGQDSKKNLTYKSIEYKDNELYTSAEQMPRFPGCEDIEGSDFEKDECAKKAMLSYIYQNLTYPKVARDKGVEGMTVVQFVVTQEGKIKDAKVVRDIDGNFGAEAKRVVQEMNNMAEKWTPGKQEGKVVDVLYTLPVKFKLEDKTSSGEPLIMVDGKEKTKGSLPEIDPETIESINVLKDHKAIEKYGDKGKYGVIEVTSKNIKVISDKINIKGDKISIERNQQINFSEFDPNILFIVNDEPIEDKKHLEDLDPSTIDRINVLKGESAIKKHGEKGKDGVVEIYLKGFDKNNDIKIDVSNVNINSAGIDESTLKPLYVLDGMVMGNDKSVISEIDSKNIKSINVYKGESAIDKYGQQAIDGVVEITSINTQLNHINESMPEEISELTKVDFLDGFRAFPIPSRGSINLELSGTPGPIQVRVYSIDGKLLHRQDFTNFQGNMSTRIENPAFTRLTAILAIIQNQQVQTKKVIFE
jgi:TonB family protein